MRKKGYEMGSRNVFKDRGLPNAEEHLIKAQLVFKIDTIMKDRGLKQVEASKLFGIPQPDVLALNQDVETVVKPHRDRSNAPALHVF